MKVICVAPERGLWEADHLNNYCHSEHHSPSLTPSVCLSVLATDSLIKQSILEQSINVRETSRGTPSL